jgi:hypothetical protein
MIYFSTWFTRQISWLARVHSPDKTQLRQDLETTPTGVDFTPTRRELTSTRLHFTMWNAAELGDTSLRFLPVCSARPRAIDRSIGTYFLISFGRSNLCCGCEMCEVSYRPAKTNQTKLVTSALTQNRRVVPTARSVECKLAGSRGGLIPGWGRSTVGLTRHPRRRASAVLLEGTAMRVLLPVSPPECFRVPTLRMPVIESDSKSQLLQVVYYGWLLDGSWQPEVLDIPGFRV